VFIKVTLGICTELIEVSYLKVHNIKNNRVIWKPELQLEAKSTEFEYNIKVILTTLQYQN